MKKIYYITISALFVSLLFSSHSFAHPGRTDSNGGHYDQSTEKYHYHHGYPAHQHENGVCPYAYDDKTDKDSSSSTDSEHLSLFDADKKTLVKKTAPATNRKRLL